MEDVNESLLGTVAAFRRISGLRFRGWAESRTACFEASRAREGGSAGQAVEVFLVRCQEHKCNFSAEKGHYAHGGQGGWKEDHGAE